MYLLYTLQYEAAATCRTNVECLETLLDALQATRQRHIVHGTHIYLRQYYTVVVDPQSEFKKNSRWMNGKNFRLIRGLEKLSQDRTVSNSAEKKQVITV